MQKFQYRIPRYTVDLPVRLKMDNLTINGRCREISREGMRLQLPQTLPPDYCGWVFLHYQELAFELQVCLAHTGGEQEGLKFVFSSDKERDAVARLVARLSAGPGHSRPTLVE